MATEVDFKTFAECMDTAVRSEYEGQNLPEAVRNYVIYSSYEEMRRGHYLRNAPDAVTACLANYIARGLFVYFTVYTRATDGKLIDAGKIDSAAYDFCQQLFS